MSTETSIGKALRLLELVAQMSGPDGVRLRELIVPAGLSKTSVFRLLSELEKQGFVDQDDETKRYRLGPKVHLLNAYHQGGTDLRQRARPLLKHLARTTGLTAHLGIREKLEVIYIEKVESDTPIRIASAIGWHAPLHCTGLGKVILAYSDPELFDQVVATGLPPRTDYTLTDAASLALELERIRRDGFGIDDRENETQVRCLAGPIFDARGNVVAAISISGVLSQVPKRNLPILSRTLREACLALASEIGYAQPQGQSASPRARPDEVALSVR
jgi:IclR family transcriptional regulator, KDG regulon repressor